MQKNQMDESRKEDGARDEVCRSPTEYPCPDSRSRVERLGKYPDKEPDKNTPLPPHIMTKLQPTLPTAPRVRSVVVPPTRAEPGSSRQHAAMRDTTMEIVT